MQRSIRRTLLIALVVAAAAIQAARSQEASGSVAAPAFKVRSYGDDRSVDVEEELQALLSANEGLVGSVKRRPMTFSAALTRVRELARSAGGAAALEPALKALPDNEPTTLRLLAVRELAQGRITAMFLLLLAAYDRDPNSPDALADLAGALAGLGYANEALAFLDELKLRNAVPSPPMEISGEDALVYLRGYCLVRLGDTAAARPLLVGVAARQPMLAEAARLMAVISDDPAEQRKFLLLGVWRHRGAVAVSADVDITGDEPDAMLEGDKVAIDLRTLLDLSKGERGRLPDLTYARSVLHANGLIPVLEAAQADVDRMMSTTLQETERPRQFRHPDGWVEETWGGRMNTVLGSLESRDQKLRELRRTLRSAVKDRIKAMQEVEEERDKLAGEAQVRFLAGLKVPLPPDDYVRDQMGKIARPFYESALSRARPIVQREETAWRDLFAEWHLLATALAGQVGDPAWREYFRQSIEHKRWYTYQRLLALAYLHAHVGAHPLITKEPGETSMAPAAQELGKCDGDKSIGFSTSELPGGQALPFEVGVEMTCEGMSVELGVDTRIPGISVSGELGVDTKGDFTAFVGPKATATLGEAGIAAFTGTAKGGVYVTGNRDGVKDAGVKYEVKAGGSIGSVSAAQKLSEGEVSFLPAPASGGTGDIEPLIISGGR